MVDNPKRVKPLQWDFKAIYNVFTVFKTTEMDQWAENERNVHKPMQCFSAALQATWHKKIARYQHQNGVRKTYQYHEQLF